MSFTIFDLWLGIIILIFTISSSRKNAINQIIGIISLCISALITKLFFYKLSVSVGSQFQNKENAELLTYIISFIIIYIFIISFLKGLAYYKEIEIEGPADQIIAIISGIIRNLLRTSLIITILKSWSIVDLQSRAAYIPLTDSIIFSYCEIISNTLFKF
tara:strand:+ start:364 stop:843 length:480 start_codon:yes stop_codon:yes gene_type:complete